MPDDNNVVHVPDIPVDVQRVFHKLIQSIKVYANAYTAEKEAAAQAEQDKLKAEEEAKKAAEEAAASGTEQPTENKVTKIASGFLGVVVLIALAAGGGFYAFARQKQKKQAEKEALDPDANYTEDKGDFEIPTDVPDEDETPDEQDTEPI